MSDLSFFQLVAKLKIVHNFPTDLIRKNPPYIFILSYKE